MTTNEREVRTVWRAVLFAGITSALAIAGALKSQEREGSAGVVNLNTATAIELQYLPRVGVKMAERLIAGRPYKSLEDVDKVRGVGVKMLGMLQPFVRFEGETTLKSKVSSSKAAKP